MQEAASGGLMEVELGKVAAQRASSSDVKEFGQCMVTDHTKANDELKDLASRKNVTLHEGLDAKQQAEVTRLSKLSGHEFDQSYMKTMTTDHEHDVAAFKKAASSSPDADVKAFASHAALVAYDLLLDHYRGEVRRKPLAAVRRHLVQVEERTKHDTDDLEDRYAQVRAEMEAARRDRWRAA
jgi:predicted outer membrane protein